MKQIVLWLIAVYQNTLSPDHGWFSHWYPYGFCRFHPSCSQYAAEAVSQKGVLTGGWLAVRRIFKCNPWHPPGIDQLKQS
ncbi:membrane protein insertion efficiency factor YidD [candidate division Kazan bacterium RBG_13_50_9]|uniref:Putative membrane protein insertion efficiency factor n=1 Tax=candidate division Kazan bacterium RBG_13_50_9 TaxID=1798535 RepID=A0A1F4NRZ7_UNCK3|nr:MAG: membrane protein insertion efficiency factor YidD [candidate division Kazan bacterium RBG_13_50_9]